MAESLVNWFIKTFGGWVSKEVLVFMVSLLPILELRGGILAGFAMGMELPPTFIIALIGNLLPIPFILLFIRYVFKLLKKTPCRKLVNWMEEKAMKKSDTIQKYGYFGIYLFVAIPLPGTGAWTGALIADMLKMDIKKAFVMIVLGVLTAGIIMSILSFGVLRSIGIG